MRTPSLIAPFARAIFAVVLLGLLDAPVAHAGDTCPADCGTADGIVDVNDLLSLLGQWGQAGACDVVPDGVVDVNDLLALIGAWGPCPGLCGAQSGVCFVANGSPGCEDGTCCQAVCTLDDFCCLVEWDQNCADAALEICTDPACPATGSCFHAHATPGCGDGLCCNLVCLVDSFCCEGQWDSDCIFIALNLCGNAQCPSKESCLVVHATPACDDPFCCNAVCLVEPFCCDVEWDQSCVDAATALCPFD